MELKACGIRASYDIPTHNIQQPIQKYTYIILVAKYLVEYIQLKAWYIEDVFE